MEFLQLTYFCYAATCQNFTKTAQHFNIPASNISRTIKDIEKELGVKLFKRSANQVTITDEGKIFLAHVKRALSELQIAKQELKAHSDVPSGELRILISSCRRIVTEAIAKCKKRYPDIRFMVKHGVDNEEYDIVISDVPPASGVYKKTPLMTEKMLLAVPPSSPLYDSENVNAQLEAQPFISLGEGTRLHAAMMQFCRSQGFQPNILIHIDDPFYVIKYLEMGLGVAIYPEKSWANLAVSDIKLLDVGIPDRQTYAFMQDKITAKPAENCFLEILRECFSNA